MNKVNMLMLKIALFALAGLLFFTHPAVFAQENRFYKLNLVYTQGKLALENVAVFPGSISTVSREGNYRYELLSLTGSSLYRDYFSIPSSTRSVRIFDPETGEFTFEVLKDDIVSVTLGIPYFPNGKEIDIYDSNNTKILKIPVIQFAKITPTPTQALNPTLAKDGGGNKTILYIGLGGLVFGVAFAVYLFRQSRRKSNQM